MMGQRAWTACATLLLFGVAVVGGEVRCIL
jgi:hypothetical protein